MKPILQPRVNVSSFLGGEAKGFSVFAASFEAWVEILVEWDLGTGVIFERSDLWYSSRRKEGGRVLPSEGSI